MKKIIREKMKQQKKEMKKIIREIEKKQKEIGNAENHLRKEKNKKKQ